MIIKLENGDKRIMVEGDDALIDNSGPYAGVFERQVKVAVDAFSSLPHREQNHE